MCEPVTASLAAMSTFQTASLALSAITGVMGFMGAQSSANAQQDSINANYTAQLNDMNARQAELDGTALADKSDVAREALMRKGQLRVATGEAGVSGLVVDSLLNDVQAQAGTSVARIEENRMRATNQNNRSRQSIYSSSQSSMNSVQKPSAFGAIAGVVGDGLSIVSANPLAKNQVKSTVNSTRNVAQNGGKI